MIKVGITGQEGFLGKHLFNYLGLMEDVELIQFKKNYFKHPANLEEFVKTCDVIVHLSAMNRHKNPQIIYDNNIKLVNQLINTCETTNSTPHIIFSSTSQEKSDNLYGKSKYIGEVNNNSNTVTLRTSIIGHELSSNHSLIDWFLSQTSSIKGYDNFIFSGLPTVELASIISNYILPNDNLFGLYHVSSDPISKYDLLVLVAEIYGKNIEIIRDKEIILNRSLDSERFQKETGYIPPKWDVLLKFMHSYHQIRK